MATVQVPTEQRLVLTGVDWHTYSRVLRLFERRRLRITFDRGALEIMTLSAEHECYKKMLARMVEALTEELALPIAGFGTMTMRRRRRQRGIEPDECYWIMSEPLIHGKTTIDLRVDPPPDVALEIDVTQSCLDRMGIYASFRVPEVWRFDGLSVTFHILQSDGRYAVEAQSRAFPGLTSADVTRFLTLRRQTDENNVLRQFRAWVRQHFLGGGAPPAAP